MPQTAAVGQHAELPAAFAAAVGEFADPPEVPLDIPADVEAVEPAVEIVECRQRIQPHVDRGAPLNAGSGLPEQLRNEHRGGRNDLRQQPERIEPLENAAHLPLQLLRNGIGAVTVCVEEQVEFDAESADLPQLVFEPFLRAPVRRGCVRAA